MGISKFDPNCPWSALPHHTLVFYYSNCCISNISLHFALIHASCIFSPFMMFSFVLFIVSVISSAYVFLSFVFLHLFSHIKNTMTFPFQMIIKTRNSMPSLPRFPHYNRDAVLQEEVPLFRTPVSNKGFWRGGQCKRGWKEWRTTRNKKVK